MALKPEFKKLLLAELRSGKWEQGNGQLAIFPEEWDDATPTKYCCLGVMCMLVDPERAWWYHADPFPERLWDEGVFGSPIPLEEAGPTSYNANGIVLGECTPYAGLLPIQDREGRRMSLAACNDFGFTFAQIADLIEMFY